MAPYTLHSMVQWCYFNPLGLLLIILRSSLLSAILCLATWLGRWLYIIMISPYADQGYNNNNYHNCCVLLDNSRDGVGDFHFHFDIYPLPNVDTTLHNFLDQYRNHIHQENSSSSWLTQYRSGCISRMNFTNGGNSNEDNSQSWIRKRVFRAG